MADDELGGEERVKRHHERGFYTVRERIDKIADPGSFVEYGPMVGAAEFDDEGNLIIVEKPAEEAETETTEVPTEEVAEKTE